MIPLIVIRPEPGCTSTVAAARQMGLPAQGLPLFLIRPIAWTPPPSDSFDALLIGSANAVREAGPALEEWHGRPAYAVGSATAEAARAAGLDVVATGQGGLQAMLGQIDPSHGRLLRLAGRENVSLSPPPGISIVERIVYSSDAVPMSDELAKLLASPAVVLLHSAEAARHFAEQCMSRAVDRSNIRLACIGPRVAAAAGQGWGAMASAEAPDDKALLALALEMCQTPIGERQGEAGLMQDEPLQSPLKPQAQSRTGRKVLAAFLLLLLVAIAAMVAVWRVPAVQKVLDALLGTPAAGTVERLAESPTAKPASQPPAAAVAGMVSPVLPIADMANQTRMAELEQRLARIELAAQAASGNATRAEGLLIAFAARRSIERGAPLGPLADQLRLRFADAQPNAVQTVIDTAANPVSLDGLYSELDAQAPRLTGRPAQEDGWSKVRRELAGLFVIRREKEVVMRPQDRLQQAKLMLAAGKVDEAVVAVEALPGAATAQTWIADARRYQKVQRALDLIEATSMLDPRRLRDDRGTPVEQVSPLAEQPAQYTPPPAN